MKGNLYVVFDVVMGESSQIAQFKNDGVALRWFDSLIQKMEGAKGDSLKLYRIGTYDNEAMYIESTYNEIPEIVEPTLKTEKGDIEN